MRTRSALSVIVVATIFLSVSFGQNNSPILAAGDPVDELRSQLSSTSVDDQLTGLQAAAELGDLAAAAVPEIDKLLASSSVAVRHEALLTLTRMGPAAAAAVPSIEKLLKDKSIIIRYAALRNLASIGPKAAAALPAVNERLMDTDTLVQVEAGLAFLSIERLSPAAVRRAVRVGMSALDKPDPVIAKEAVSVLSLCGNTAVAPLTSMLSKNPSSQMCHNVCEALSSLGSVAAPARIAIVKLLEYEDPVVRSHALTTLRRIAQPAQIPEILPAVTAALKDKVPSVRLNALETIAYFGPAAAAALPDVIACSTDPEDLVRSESMATIAALGLESQDAAKALDVGLGDSVAFVTLRAAESLPRIGTVAVPILKKRLSDPQYRRLAAIALSEMKATAAPAEEELVSLLSCDDVEDRRAVIFALAAIGPGASNSAKQALTTMLRDTAAETRGAAAYALACMGVSEVLPDLREYIKKTPVDRLALGSAVAVVLLQPESADDIQAAVPVMAEGLLMVTGQPRRILADVLGQLGERSAPAVESLKVILKDEEPASRLAALNALAGIGPAAAPAVSDLQVILNDGDAAERNTAALALGRIGAAAAAAVPDLRKQLIAHDEFERFAAAWALVKINPSEEQVKAFEPLAIQMLGEGPPRARLGAIDILMSAGKPSAAALAALQTASNDPDPVVKAAVTAALSTK